MIRVKIKPREGFTVRGPDKQKLPAEGKEVVLSSFWVRRLRDGDVERVDSEASRAVTAPMRRATTKGEK